MNLQPGETGYVLFSIKPEEGLISGTEIENIAEIQFEVFDPILTNEGIPVVSIIDSTKPMCDMNPLPSQSSAVEILFHGQGSDEIGEIKSYTILLSSGGGDFEVFFDATSDTSATFIGENGNTYGFACVATDSAGNIETQNAVAEAEQK